MHREQKSHSGSPERATKEGELPRDLIELEGDENGTHTHIFGTWDVTEHQAVGIFAAKTLSADTHLTKTTTTGGNYAKQT